jgi:hypothetical protein
MDGAAADGDFANVDVNTMSVVVGCVDGGGAVKDGVRLMHGRAAADGDTATRDVAVDVGQTDAQVGKAVGTSDEAFIRDVAAAAGGASGSPRAWLHSTAAHHLASDLGGRSPPAHLASGGGMHSSTAEHLASDLGGRSPPAHLASERHTHHFVCGGGGYSPAAHLVSGRGGHAQWELLPAELWREVLSWLDLRSLGAVALTCRTLSR